MTVSYSEHLSTDRLNAHRVHTLYIRADIPNRQDKPV